MYKIGRMAELHPLEFFLVPLDVQQALLVFGIIVTHPFWGDLTSTSVFEITINDFYDTLIQKICFFDNGNK